MTLFPFVQVLKYESYVGIRIAPTESRHRSFHIAFVLDVSGSMAGERLKTVQKTLHLFADEMQPDDSVSVITYNTEAHILCRQKDRASLLPLIDGLKADGGTNIEAGLLALAGLDLANLDAIFLLTDGQVNQGISSVAGLEGIARMVAFDSHKIPVYTLGYGADHNARLLQAMAVATRASYTFAETHEMIPSVVGSILVAMRDEVVKGVTLTWTGDAVCWEAGATPETKTFCVGSVIANKPQWIVLRGSVESLHIHADGMAPCVLDMSQQEGNEDVLEQWFRAESVRVLSESLECGPMAGLPKLQTLEDAILASPVASRPLMLRIRAQIAEQRAHLDQVQPPPVYRGLQRQAAGGYHGGGHIGYGGGLSRLVSGMTAFATQRGDPDFCSPSQRAVSGAMVHHFHSGATDVTDNSNGDPDSLHP